MAIYLIVAIALLVLAGLALLVKRLILNVGPVACDPEWIEKFSAARYKPMTRLLTDDDYEFLQSVAGCSPDAVRKLRAERRAIFRAYLKNLIRDFNRLHLAARVLALDSPVDRPDLAADLVRTRAAFERAVLGIRFRLLLHTFGLGAVDTRELLGLLDKISGECRLLVPVPASRPSF
jgi:hypothetical protein